MSKDFVGIGRGIDVTQCLFLSSVAIHVRTYPVNWKLRNISNTLDNISSTELYMWDERRVFWFCDMVVRSSEVELVNNVEYGQCIRELEIVFKNLLYHDPLAHR